MALGRAAPLPPTQSVDQRQEIIARGEMDANRDYGSYAVGTTEHKNKAEIQRQTAERDASYASQSRRGGGGGGGAASPAALPPPAPAGGGGGGGNGGGVGGIPPVPSPSPSMVGLQSAGGAPAPLDALNGPTSNPLRRDLGSRTPPSLQALLQGVRY